MWWFIAIVALAIILVLPLFGRGSSVTKKVLAIQDICSKNYWNFDLYVSTSTDFTLDDAPSKDSLRIMFDSPFGLRKKYLTYHGQRPVEEALDELIKHFQD